MSMSKKITQYQCFLSKEKHPILRETATYEVAENIILSPEGVKALSNDCLDFEHLAEEYVVAIATTTKGEVLGLFEISHGVVDASLISPRELFLRLLLCGATSFIMAHNHPSGDISPSKQDIDVYRRILECSKLMNISLLDNVIVGSEGIYSFRQEGRL